MAYLGTVEVFRCDYCEDQQTVRGGLPPGWVWVKLGGRVGHACETCRDKVPEEKRREAGQLN